MSGDTPEGRIGNGYSTAGAGGTVPGVERGSHPEIAPDALTRDVRAARTRRGLLSDAVARESGVSVEAVIRVLSNDPTPANREDAVRLRAWAQGILEGRVTRQRASSSEVDASIRR